MALALIAALAARAQARLAVSVGRRVLPGQLHLNFASNTQFVDPSSQQPFPVTACRFQQHITLLSFSELGVLDDPCHSCQFH